MAVISDIGQRLQETLFPPQGVSEEKKRDVIITQLWILNV